MEEKEEDKRKEKKQNKRKIQGPNSQLASQPASQLIKERRKGDIDDESLVRNEWERKRKRGKKSNKKILCKKRTTSERVRASL